MRLLRRGRHISNQRVCDTGVHGKRIYRELLHSAVSLGDTGVLRRKKQSLEVPRQGRRSEMGKMGEMGDIIGKMGATLPSVHACARAARRDLQQ